MDKYPRGTDLPISWGFETDLTDYSAEFEYYTGAGRRLVPGSAYTISDNTLSWVFAGDDQPAYGVYGLRLVLRSGDTEEEFRLPSAFELTHEEESSTSGVLQLNSTLTITTVEPEEEDDDEQEDSSSPAVYVSRDPFHIEKIPLGDNITLQWKFLAGNDFNFDLEECELVLYYSASGSGYRKADNYVLQTDNGYVLEWQYAADKQFRFGLYNLFLEVFYDDVLVAILVRENAFELVHRRGSDIRDRLVTFESVVTSLGAGALYSLYDILNDGYSTVYRSDGTTPAEEGDVLMFNGVKWYASESAGGYASLEEQIEALQTSVSLLDGRVYDVEVAVAGLEYSLSALSSRVSDAEGNIATLEVDTASIAARVGSAEGDIATLELTASGLSTRVTNAEGDIGALEVTAGRISLSVDNINNGLAATGIDITNGKIVMTADNILLRSNNKTAALSISLVNNVPVIDAANLNVSGIFTSTAGTQAMGSALTTFYNEQVAPIASDVAGFNYLKAATNNGTLISGGLVLSSLIQLGGGDPYTVMSGINGLLDTSLVTPQESIAAWFGGPMVDWKKNPSAASYAATLFRMDGSGYIAGGEIQWGASGDLIIHGATFQGTGSSSVTIDDLLELKSWFTKAYWDDSGGRHYYLRLVGSNTGIEGLVADGFISAGGLSSAGGGGGATTLAGLSDVSLSSPSNGQALVYRNGAWTNESVGGGSVTQINVGSTAYTPSGGVVSLPAYPVVPSTLPNPYSLTFGSNTYDGSSSKTITASDLGAITSHQSVILASGTNNGTLKITTASGTTDNIGVTGLGSLAYKSSLVASDIPDLSGAYLKLTGGTLTGDLEIRKSSASLLLRQADTGDPSNYYFRVTSQYSEAAYLDMSAGPFATSFLQVGWNTALCLYPGGSGKVGINVSTTVVKDQLSALYVNGNQTLVGNLLVYGGTPKAVFYSTQDSSYNASIEANYSFGSSIVIRYGVSGYQDQVLVSGGFSGSTPNATFFSNRAGVLNVNGNLTATGAITAGSASDIRLKKNIADLSIDRAKKIVLGSRPVEFEWNEKAEELYDRNVGDDIGLIAQEVQKYLPKAVSPIWDKYMRVDYSKFIAPLIKLAQEQEKRIVELENRLKN